MTYGTVDVVEVIWMLAALPGLVMWGVNWGTARRSLQSVKALGVGNGRLVVAQYGVQKAYIMITVHLVFALIGLIAMVRPANAAVAPWDWIRVVLTAGLIGAPVLLSFLAWRWRVVDRQIIRMAHERRSAGAGADVAIKAARVSAKAADEAVAAAHVSADAAEDVVHAAEHTAEVAEGAVIAAEIRDEDERA